MATTNKVVNDVNTHIEWKNCSTGKYPCDPRRNKEDAWARQFTQFPSIIHREGNTSITGEYSYEALKMNPSGVGFMPEGTVLHTRDGVTKI